MKKFSRFAALALLVAIGSGASAAPTCKLKPGKALVYRLELTVPATFCSGNNQDISCDEFPKQSNIQLHGLWPNYAKGGHPEGDCGSSGCPRPPQGQGKFCGYPKPPGLYGSAAWLELKGYMAGVEKCLERHEWVKHGTCTKMRATDYFEWSLKETERISDQLALPADTEITRDEFNQWVKERLAQYDGALRLTCRGEKLNSIYVLLEWETPPGKPIPAQNGNHFGNCKGSFFVPTKPD